VLEFCLPKLSGNAPGRLQCLDVGVGTAKAWEDLLTHDSVRRACIDFHGCDLSPGNLEVCKSKTSIPFAVDGLKEVNMIEYPWPYTTGQFDVVVCVGCFAHLKRNPEMLQEFARITKTGGYILLGHRNDTYPSFQQVDQKLLREGVYQLINATPYRPLYFKLPEDHEDAKVEFTIHTLQRLEKNVATVDIFNTTGSTKAARRAAMDEGALIAESETLIVITTAQWSRMHFLQGILPRTLYSGVSDRIVFFDMPGMPFDDRVKELAALLEAPGSTPKVFAITDAAMECLTAAAEIAKGGKEIVGAHFLTFQLATNKLAGRKLVRRCDGVKCSGVLSSDDFLPEVGAASFFKPLADNGSAGVFKFSGKDTANPLKGTKNRLVELGTMVRDIAKNYEELAPYMKPELVGIVEEYVDPNERVGIINVDGFIHEGKVYHYCLSDNVYLRDEPETFDYIVAPSQLVKPRSPEADKLWKLYDDAIGDLARRGCNNQFVNIEAFLYRDGRVEVQEINGRTFAPLVILLSRVYGAQNCMFAASLDLLWKKCPACAADLPLADPGKTIGVCTFVDHIEGGTGVFDSSFGDMVYYSPGKSGKAYCYGVGTEEPASLVSKCRAFHADLKARMGRKRSLAD
jgi:SAM-dependent methyltransferase